MKLVLQEGDVIRFGDTNVYMGDGSRFDCIDNFTDHWIYHGSEWCGLQEQTSLYLNFLSHLFWINTILRLIVTSIHESMVHLVV